MTGPQIAFNPRSANRKTGPIPVTTTEEATCPTSCALKKNGCYADGGPLALYWRKVSDPAKGNVYSWGAAMEKIAALPAGTLWRHNQAGDLPGEGDAIDSARFWELVDANEGKRGFTYTHKPVQGAGWPAILNLEIVKAGNEVGFTVNLSADDLAGADRLAALDIGPVVVVLPSDQMTPLSTPQGRPVAICPAVLSDDVTCATCGVCALRDRKSIIGFPAHGSARRKASTVAKGKD